MKQIIEKFGPVTLTLVLLIGINVALAGWILVSVFRYERQIFTEPETHTAVTFNMSAFQTIKTRIQAP